MGRLRTLPLRVGTLDNRIAAPPPKKADPFYLSKPWRELVDRIVAERGRRCEDPRCSCGGRTHKRVFADHIVELQDGGAPLDERNVMLRCGSSHTRKTAVERAKRQSA